MEIKHKDRITWNDLPGLESPFFARHKISRDAFDTLSGLPRIRGMDEALRRYHSLYILTPRDRNREIAWLIEHIERGEFALVFPENELPMHGLLRWRTEDNPQGYWMPRLGDRFALPEKGRWMADPDTPFLLRRPIEDCLAQARRNPAIARNLPEHEWWKWRWQRSGGSPGPEEQPDVEEAPKARRAYTGGGDRVVSLQEPDPGFVKVGLFGPTPPRMSDKAFEANLCEWACECMGVYGPSGTHQSCVDQKIRQQYYDSTNHPRDNSPVWSEVSYHKYDSVSSNTDGFGMTRKDYEKYDLVESRAYPGKPTSWYPRPNTWRLDVLKIGSDGKPEKFYDMKFPGDKTENDLNWPERKKAYENIAKKHTGDQDNYVTFDIEKKCRNCQKQEQEQPQQSTQGESKGIGERFKDILKSPEPPPSFPPDPGSGPKPPSLPPVLPLPGMPPILI
ncbi:MAG: hypothetical protein LBK55_07535 [Azoarcus sp.]|nr:hypothetical protein [Azoarcus sp.]